MSGSSIGTAGLQTAPPKIFPSFVIFLLCVPTHTQPAKIKTIFTFYSNFENIVETMHSAHITCQNKNIVTFHSNFHNIAVCTLLQSKANKLERHIVVSSKEKSFSCRALRIGPLELQMQQSQKRIAYYLLNYDCSTRNKFSITSTTSQSFF